MLPTGVLDTRYIDTRMETAPAKDNPPSASPRKTTEITNAETISSISTMAEVVALKNIRPRW